MQASRFNQSCQQEPRSKFEFLARRKVSVRQGNEHLGLFAAEKQYRDIATVNEPMIAVRKQELRELFQILSLRRCCFQAASAAFAVSL